MLQINDLKTYYYKKDRHYSTRGLQPEEDRYVKAVDGARLKIPASSILAIVGESGCGKTTMGLSITNLINPQDGRIVFGSVVFEGENLLRLPKKTLLDIRGKMISYIFQEPASALNPVFTIGEQIKEVLLAHRIVPRAEVINRAKDALKEAGLTDPDRIFNLYPHQLSGGMKQRAMIAMAIATGPKLLIADEPTTALDKETEEKILQLLVKLRKDLSLSILLITHNICLVRRIADITAVMYNGRIIEVEQTNKLFQNPRHPYTKTLLESLPQLIKS